MALHRRPHIFSSPKRAPAREAGAAITVRSPDGGAGPWPTHPGKAAHSSECSGEICSAISILISAMSGALTIKSGALGDVPGRNRTCRAYGCSIRMEMSVALLAWSTAE